MSSYKSLHCFASGTNENRPLVAVLFGGLACLPNLVSSLGWNAGMHTCRGRCSEQYARLNPGHVSSGKIRVKKVISMPICTNGIFSHRLDILKRWIAKPVSKLSEEILRDLYEYIQTLGAVKLSARWRTMYCAGLASSLSYQGSCKSPLLSHGHTALYERMGNHVAVSELNT